MKKFYFDIPDFKKRVFRSFSISYNGPNFINYLENIKSYKFLDLPNTRGFVLITRVLSSHLNSLKGLYK